MNNMNHPFLYNVAADIKQRFGDELADVAIVFNNKRPITYLKKELAAAYGKAIWSPQFFTIQEFFKQASNATESSQLTQFFYLFELHNELLLAEGSPVETLEEFYPIAEIILSDFGQLDYELVPIEQIYMDLQDTTQIDITFQHFTAEQQQFIRQFWQSFSAAGHHGLQQRFLKLWKRLPKLYQAFKAKLKAEKQLHYPTLYRDLVDNKVERPDFIDRYKKVLFVGFNALNKAEVQLFQGWQAAEKALFYFDADAYYMDDAQQEAGLFIRRNVERYGLINALGSSPARIANRENTVNIYACDGKNNQAKVLHDILQQQHDPARSAAILLADESLLVPLLQSLPDLEVNITTGYPLLQSPLYGLINLWLDVQEEISQRKRKKISYQQLSNFLNHPLSRVAESERNELLNEISDKQLYEVPINRLRLSSSVFPNFFKALDNPTALIPTLMLLLDEVLVSIAAQDKLRQIDSNLIIETKKVLNQLQQGFHKIGESSISFQIGLIRKAIAPINSAIEGDPLKGVQIMGLLESRCLNFDEVYILGANEGILPQTSNSPTFLPNSLRQAYDLPVLENQDALSAYLFYRHFQYSGGLHVFYNSLVDENSSGEESRFIKQLQFESNFRFTIHQQQQTIRFADKSEELIIPKEGAIWQQLFTQYIGQKKRLAATALTTYLQSPLQFFIKYVANIKEPPNISQEFEMNRLGTVIHNVMEQIFAPYKGLADFTPTKVLAIETSLIEKLIVQEIGVQYHTEIQKAEQLNSMQQIMLRIAQAYIGVFLEYDQANYSAFRIIELENDQDYVLDFPINVQGKEESIRLFGIIDRVDEVITPEGELKTRIVDYKTGGDRVGFRNIEKVFCGNTENKALVQTLFYTHVFEQLSGRTALEPHLYVARHMREEGTLFCQGQTQLTGEALRLIKEEFVTFLRNTLEEIFNPDIPFRHNPESKPYPSDPYTLFYRNAIEEEDTLLE